MPGSWLEPGKPAKFEVTGSASASQRWFGLYVLPDPVSPTARSTAR